MTQTQRTPILADLKEYLSSETYETDFSKSLLTYLPARGTVAKLHVYLFYYTWHCYVLGPS